MGPKKKLEESNRKLEEAKKNLLEIWHWSFKRMRETCQGEDISAYEAGVLHGMHDATSAVLLQMIGGENMYKLWESALTAQEGEQE